jgi:hypothetical protein
MTDLRAPLSNKEQLPELPTVRCVVCGEPLDEYMDCLESDSGDHVSPVENAKARAVIEREAERTRIRRAWVLR